jgi:amino acid transporter
MATSVLKRLLVGNPLATTQMKHTLLPKWLALPVFCSDPISSVAYATEEILLVLAAGGAAALGAAPWIAVVVALLLVVVVASYRQTCHAYPSGGGAYAVSRANLGETAALTAAAALLVDYVMTVAVSVVAGVVAITSAVPAWGAYRVEISVGFVLLLTLANLRGVKESGRLFAVPTYVFIGLTLLMFAVAGIRAAAGGLPAASTASQTLPATHTTGMLFVLLVLRAFASGCTALTGVEAISNGVPSFRKPKPRNAAATLTIMGTLAVALFGGVTVLGIGLHARAQPSGTPSVISQIAASVFGAHAVLFYLFQAATAAILILAANTAFNGFPVLASILSRDRYLPRQLHARGDRLVFSNGVLLLAGFAIALIVGFDANADKLIQLYIVGVFTGFTLSQIGMVRHWNRVLASGDTDGRSRTGIRRAQALNALGAAATGVVLVVVFATKVVHGAWLAVLAMVVMFAVMKTIHRYYARVSAALAPEPGTPTLPARVHALVLVSQLHKPALRALAFAKATRPDTLTAISAADDPEAASALRDQWNARGIPIPLKIIEAPYRDIFRPLLARITELRDQHPRDLVTVFIPEYVVTRWWQNLLHNQSALRLKGRLLYTPGVVVVDVPYRLDQLNQGWLGTPLSEIRADPVTAD